MQGARKEFLLPRPFSPDARGAARKGALVVSMKTCRLSSIDAACCSIYSAC